MSWINRVAAVLVSGLALCAGPALAEGDFNFVGRFVNADTEVDVATFALVNDQGVEERIILLGVINGDKNISISFSPSETPALVNLWRQARDAQSTDWRPVGELVETGTVDVAHLRVSAGPGVRFVIESQAGGPLTSDLQPSDMAAFETALDRAEAFVENRAP